MVDSLTSKIARVNPAPATQGAVTAGLQTRTNITPAQAVIHQTLTDNMSNIQSLIQQQGHIRGIITSSKKTGTASV